MKLLLFSGLLIFYFELAAQLGSENQIKVDQIFNQWNHKNSPGAALSIIKDGKIIYSKGYGMADLEHDIPVTDSTIFYIGSVSKQFVTMCILLLEEQGKLKLNDKVQKYLSDFPEYESPITIQHFIHHTSGVRDNLTLWELAGNSILDHIDKEEMYQMIKRQKTLNFPPGEKYLYSNSCYFMLALIIEKVSGESLKSFAQKNIFQPLSMNHTFFGDDNTKIIKNRAFSYNTTKDGFTNNIMRFDLVGSGGLYSNIKDMYLWDQNFYNNKLGKRNMALINKMHQDGLLNNGQSCGYAYALHNGTYRGLKTVSHGGALAGYRSFYLRFPQENLSIVILGNLGQLNTGNLANKVADIVLLDRLKPIIEKDAPGKFEIVDHKPKLTGLHNFDQFLGNYFSEELDVTYRLFIQENQLFYSIKNMIPLKLSYDKEDTFLSPESFALKFERDALNKISGFTLDAGRVTNLKFIRK